MRVSEIIVPRYVFGMMRLEELVTAVHDFFQDPLWQGFYDVRIFKHAILKDFQFARSKSLCARTCIEIFRSLPQVLPLRAFLQLHQGLRVFAALRSFRSDLKAASLREFPTFRKQPEKLFLSWKKWTAYETSKSTKDQHFKLFVTYHMYFAVRSGR